MATGASTAQLTVILKTLTDAHNLRNARTYRTPIPPITHAQADGVVALLDATYPKVCQIVAPSTNKKP